MSLVNHRGKLIVIFIVILLILFFGYYLWPYLSLSSDIPYAYTESGIRYDDEIDSEGIHHLSIMTEEGSCEEGGEFKFYNHFNNTLYVYLYEYDNLARSKSKFCTLELISRDIEFVSKDKEMPKLKVYYYWHKIEPIPWD